MSKSKFTAQENFSEEQTCPFPTEKPYEPQSPNGAKGDIQPVVLTKSSLPFVSKKKMRLRLMIAIPVLTTLLVLGLGLIIIDLNQRELLSSRKSPSLSQVELAIDHTTLVIIVAGTIALIAGLALAYTITLPIRQLTMGTSRIAKGDLTRGIKLDGESEISQLGTAFNEMLTSINKYFLQTMGSGIITINSKGIITSVSTDAEVILGFFSQAIIGKHISQILPDTHENLKFLQLISDTLSNKKTYSSIEMTISTENRENIPVSISTSLLRDRDDTLVGLIIAFEDVVHLKKIQEHMKKIDRLTTLGGLAAGVAHQVRNPLCSIRGLAQLLRERYLSDKSMLDYTDVILKDVERINGVIERLLRFLQPTTSVWKYENANNLLKDVLLLGKHEIRKKEIEIIEEYAEDIPLVYAQSENLLQAFLNVLINAFQAIDNTGTVLVRTSVVSEGNSSESEDFVLVEIIDNGPGISNEDINKIFEPSFTTKETGSGFGLVITRQTIEAHNGRVTVRSIPYKETVFSMYLPIKTETYATTT